MTSWAHHNATSHQRSSSSLLRRCPAGSADRVGHALWHLAASCPGRAMWQPPREAMHRTQPLRTHTGSPRAIPYPAGSPVPQPYGPLCGRPWPITYRHVSPSVAAEAPTLPRNCVPISSVSRNFGASSS
jgi:hypothetical protein